MKHKDRNLGMNRPISRRDLLHGLGGIAAASLVPGQALADAVMALETAGTENDYPPALSGLRGNHNGSFETAHLLAREDHRDWGPLEEPDSPYDLVVVGGGISGLCSAYFYRQQHPNARVLILDNHDDFGGHAKRNEFTVGDRTLIGYGGSQSIENPGEYPPVALELLHELGVELSSFETAYDQNFYKRNGLGGGVFFNKGNWGSNTLLAYDLANLKSYLPLAESQFNEQEAVDNMPLSGDAKAEMLRLLTATEDNMPQISEEEKEDYIWSISYQDYLKKHLGIHHPEVFAALKDLTTDSGVNIDSASAGGALLYNYLPGFRAAGLWDYEMDEPYIYHFPDGNASIARQLVRRMIPRVASGSTMTDLLSATFDYGALDKVDAPVRLRLNSTVVNVAHRGNPATSKSVDISYVRAGKSYRVQARACVLACYNAIIPALCPELPKQQRAALSEQVKSPILYTSVALNNWRAFKNLGVGAVASPGSYHPIAMLDFPVNMAGYQFASNPDDPIVLHMERFPHSYAPGLTRNERYRQARHQMLAEPFESVERNIRSQLADMLSGGGFDPARDIAAITVNRWAHGYSNSYDPMTSPDYPDWDDPRYPHVQGRKPFGKITIANSDSNADASLSSAITQAYRAVSELA